MSDARKLEAHNSRPAVAISVLLPLPTGPATAKGPSPARIIDARRRPSPIGRGTCRGSPASSGLCGPSACQSICCPCFDDFLAPCIPRDGVTCCAHSWGGTRGSGYPHPSPLPEGERGLHGDDGQRPKRPLRRFFASSSALLRAASASCRAFSSNSF